MTRYDPFTFGTVKLGGQAAAADGQPTAPDDLLFADAGSVKQAPAAADGDWSALTDDASSLLPTARRETTSAVDQFGTDILGEAAPAPAPASAPAPAAETQPVRPKASTTPRSADAASRAAIASPNAAKPTRQSPLQTGAVTAAAAAAAAAAATATTTTGTAAARTKPANNGSVPLRTARLPGRSRSPMFALLVAVGVLAAGGAIASWLWLMQQNQVMAGIVGLSTLVGSALAHVAFRR